MRTNRFLPETVPTWVDHGVLMGSIAFGIVGPIACFVEASRMEMFVHGGGLLYAGTAAFVVVLAIALASPRAGPKRAAVQGAALSVGACVAVVMGVLFVPFGFLFLAGGIDEWRGRDIYLGLLGIMPLPAAGVFGFHAIRSFLRADTRLPSHGWFVLLGMALPMVAGVAGWKITGVIDRYCARVIIEEGEAGSSKLAIWKPMSSLLPLEDVRVAYREEIRTAGNSERARSMSRAYSAFVPMRYLESGGWD